MSSVATTVVAEVRKQALQSFFQVRTLFWNVILPFGMIATFYFMYLPFVGREIFVRDDPFVELPLIGFLVAGQIVYTLYTNTLLGGNFFDAERELQTLEVILLTPTSRFGILLGSALAGFLLNVWMFVSVVLVFVITPGVGVNVGDPAAAAGSLFFSAFSLLGLGMCLGCVFVLTRRGGQITVSIQEPIDFLSGLRFPVRILPGVLQSVASVLPLTYGIRATRMSLVGGASVKDVWADLLVLALIGTFLMLLSHYLVVAVERRAKRQGTLSLF